MAKTRPPLARAYWGADVPMAAIRRFARPVAEQFRPDRVILFGSHAYGTPTADSDVHILVIAPTRRVGRNPASCLLGRNRAVNSEGRTAFTHSAGSKSIVAPC